MSKKKLPEERARQREKHSEKFLMARDAIVAVRTKQNAYAAEIRERHLEKVSLEDLPPDLLLKHKELEEELKEALNRYKEAHREEKGYDNLTLYPNTLVEEKGRVI